MADDDHDPTRPRAKTQAGRGMTTAWLRLWHDMPTDPKFRVVARRAGRPLCEVLAVFVLMLTNASSNASARGKLQHWSDEDAAAALDMDADHVTAIREAMAGKTLDGEELTGWSKRQPQREDWTAPKRQKQWRERNATSRNVTPEKRKKTQRNAPYKDTDTDTDTDAEEEEDSDSQNQLTSNLHQGGLGEKSILQGGGSRPAVAQRDVSEAALEEVRTIAAGWDRQFLLARYQEWPQAAEARNPDRAFLGWVRKYVAAAKKRGVSHG